MTSKRFAQLKEKATDNILSLEEAVALVKSYATAKFDESVDICYSLGIDPKKSDQNIKAACPLPHGLGKSVKVAVFAVGDAASAAEKAGADRVGFEDLADDMKKGDLDYDVVIATQESMALVGRLGQVLGPKGLMPNLKLGTVTPNPAEAVKLAKAGQFKVKNDKSGLVHGSVGRASFADESLVENIRVLTQEVKRLKPTVAKGIYLKAITLSLTMSPSVRVDVSKV
jgi:large subunit ribosomal protein L1